MRAHKFTIENKKIERYSDFTIGFDLNPITGQLAKVTNEGAVGNAIKNLLMTELTERFYHPEIGSKINSLLFDLDDPETINLLRVTISETIRNHEPRAILNDLIINDDPDNHGVRIRVVYSLINIPEPYIVNLLIKRTR